MKNPERILIRIMFSGESNATATIATNRLLDLSKKENVDALVYEREQGYAVKGDPGNFSLFVAQKSSLPVSIEMVLQPDRLKHFKQLILNLFEELNMNLAICELPMQTFINNPERL